VLSGCFEWIVDGGNLTHQMFVRGGTVNGFLPRNLGSANPSGAAVHSSVHTGAYYETVNELMLGATSQGEALDALAYLRGGLLSGGL
jgi:hypothetical protein